MSVAKIRVEFEVNGAKKVATAYPMARLLDVLREELKLTGTKEGCGEGECGACSVMMDGVLVKSCLVPFAQVGGAKVKTIEGVESGGVLHVVQEAFLDGGGAQCGICTPGMILASVDLLERNAAPTEDDVKVALAGNICRCTGYTKIFASVLDAADRLRRDERDKVDARNARAEAETRS